MKLTFYGRYDTITYLTLSYATNIAQSLFHYFGYSAQCEQTYGISGAVDQWRYLWVGLAIALLVAAIASFFRAYSTYNSRWKWIGLAVVIVSVPLQLIIFVIGQFNFCGLTF